MNKITLWAAFMLSFTIGGYAQSCDPVTSFNQNFDTVVSPDLPGCWSKILSGETLSEWAYIETVISEGYTQPNGVTLYSSGSDTAENDIILVSPAVSNSSFLTHRIRFYAKGAGELQIGTLDDNTDASTFNLVETIETTDEFHQYVVNFDTYSGTGTHIGIRFSAPDMYTGIVLDNIIYEAIPPCPDVTDISFSDITTITATANWNAESGGNSWEYVYGPATVTDPAGLSPTTSSATSVVLTGLEANTTYNVWVRSLCEAGIGYWAGPETFKTACLPTAYVSENFDASTNLPDCWATILRGEGLTTAASINVVASGNSSPNSVTFFPFNSNISGTAEMILVSPALSNLGADYRLKLHASKAGTFEIGTLDTNDDSAVFTSFDNITVTSSYAEYKIDFSSYDGTDKYIGIRLTSTTGFSFFQSVNVDDIIWEPNPACPDIEISGISFSDITTTSANVLWEPADDETTWQVAYGPLSIIDPADAIHVDATGSSNKVITELTENTGYKVWVRSMCSAGTGAWIGPVIFRTACLPTTAFNENADSVTAPELPNCWSKIIRGESMGQYANIVTMNSDSHSGSNSINLYNDYTDTSANSETVNDIILVSPNLTNLANSSYRLKFYALSYQSGSIQIGTLNGSDNSADFTPLEVEDILLTDSYHQYVVNFDNYTGTDTYIGIRLTSEQYVGVYVDDLVWEPMPACPDVENIEVPSMTTNSATVTWNPGANESAWQVTYGVSSVTDPAGLTPINAATTTQELTTLTANTTYNVWVRSVCGENYGGWIGPVAFSTLCSATDVPYLQDFGSADSQIPACSIIANLGAGNDWTVSDVSEFGFDSALRYTYSVSDPADAWFFTQGINLIAGIDYDISYKYGTNTDSEGSYLESFKVLYGTEPSADGMTMDIADHADIIGTTPSNDTVTFSPPTTGVYYFGFNVYSTANQNSLFIDDIAINTNLSTGSSTLSDFTYYPNPVKDVLNLSYDKNITEATVINLLGQTMLKSNGNGNSLQLNMATLPSGNYMVKVVSDNQTKIIKVIKE